MDVVGANFDNALDEVRERLDGRPVAGDHPHRLRLDQGQPHAVQAVIDLIEHEACCSTTVPRPADGKTIRRGADSRRNSWAEAQTWREQLFDVLTQHDDRGPDHQRSTSTARRSRLRDAFANCSASRRSDARFSRCFCGSGREHIGIQPLLDGVVWYLPSPLDRPPVEGTNPKKKDKEENAQARSEGAVLPRWSSRSSADPHGELYYLRIYSGTSQAQQPAAQPRQGHQGDHQQALPRPRRPDAHATSCPRRYAGDIVAVDRPKESITGDTLCDPQHPILLETDPLRRGGRQPVDRAGIEQ